MRETTNMWYVWCSEWITHQASEHWIHVNRWFPSHVWTRIIQGMLMCTLTTMTSDKILAHNNRFWCGGGFVCEEVRSNRRSPYPSYVCLPQLNAAQVWILLVGVWKVTLESVYREFQSGAASFCVILGTVGECRPPSPLMWINVVSRCTPPICFCENRPSIFSVILQTDTQTEKPTLAKT